MKRLYRYAAVGVVLVGAYFLNVEIQSALGRRAVRNTGLVNTPLATAEQRVAGSDKLVLADLAAIWCPVCRAFDERVLSDAAVKRAIERGYVYSRIEYESKEGLAFRHRYGVSGYPRLLLLDGQGRVVKRLNVDLDPQAFLGELVGTRSSAEEKTGG